jgi:hypothetical protein
MNFSPYLETLELLISLNVSSGHSILPTTCRFPFSRGGPNVVEHPGSCAGGGSGLI